MKQKLDNIIYQIVYGAIFFIPLFFVCLLAIGTQMSIPFFIVYLLVSAAILIFRKKIVMLKPLWALYMKTTYVNEPTNVKRNLRPGRIISVALVLIAVLLMQFEYRTFQGDTIDEVISKKYQCECEYLESNGYYYIVNMGGEKVRDLPDIAVKRPDGKYTFFSSGVFGYPRETQQLDCTDMQVDFCTIYKLTKDNAYIIFVQDSDSAGDVAVYDTSGEMAHLTDAYGNVVWFKVLNNLDDGYKVYSKKGDTESFIVDGPEIMRRFSK